MQVVTSYNHVPIASIEKLQSWSIYKHGQATIMVQLQVWTSYNHGATASMDKLQLWCNCKQGQDRTNDKMQSWPTAIMFCTETKIATIDTLAIRICPVTKLQAGTDSIIDQRQQKP